MPLEGRTATKSKPATTSRPAPGFRIKPRAMQRRRMAKRSAEQSVVIATFGKDAFGGFLNGAKITFKSAVDGGVEHEA